MSSICRGLDEVARVPSRGFVRSQRSSRRTPAPSGIGAASGIAFGGNTMLNSGASHANVGGMGRHGNGRTIGGPGAVYAVADASQLTMDSGQSGALTCSS